jgi:hypothetical protein
LLMPINPMVFTALSCTRFKVSGLMLRSIIYLKFLLVQGKRNGSSFCFLHAHIQFSQQQFLKRLSFFHCFFGAFVKNQLGIAV